MPLRDMSTQFLATDDERAEVRAAARIIQQHRIGNETPDHRSGRLEKMKDYSQISRASQAQPIRDEGAERISTQRADAYAFEALLFGQSETQRFTTDAQVEQTRRVDGLIEDYLASKGPRIRGQEPTDFSDYTMSRMAALTYEQTEFPKADQLIFAERNALA